MAVKTAYFKLFAVKIKAVFFKSCLSEAETLGFFVKTLKLYFKRVKLGHIRFPKLYARNRPFYVDFFAFKSALARRKSDAVFVFKCETKRAFKAF